MIAEPTEPTRVRGEEGNPTEMKQMVGEVREELSEVRGENGTNLREEGSVFGEFEYKGSEWEREGEECLGGNRIRNLLQQQVQEPQVYEISDDD